MEMDEKDEKDEKNEKETRLLLNTMGFTFWYRGHFNRECEPFSYLWIALAGAGGASGNVAGKGGKYIIPNEHENEVLDTAYHSQKINHSQYMNSLISNSSEQEEKHLKQQSTSITLPFSSEETLWKTSLLVYQFVNKYDVLEPTSACSSSIESKSASVQRPTEQRIDELIIPFAELLLALCPEGITTEKRKSMGWLSKMGKFSFILFPQSSFLSINNSKVCIKHSLIDIAKQIDSDSKEKANMMKWMLKKDQARYRLHTASADDNESFYKQGPEYKWFSKHVRFCNMSYIALPCVTSRVQMEKMETVEKVGKIKKNGPDVVPSTLLPGWAYLQPKFNDNVPYRDQHVQFCMNQATLALDRMNIKIDHLLSGNTALNVNLLMEYLVEIICWPARMAIYMRDLFDNCPPETETKREREREREREPKNFNVKVNTLLTAWRTNRMKKHKNKLIDQFALPWSGMFPEKFADDCETLILACYVVYKALIGIVFSPSSSSSSSLPRELSILKPIMSQYTFVMAAVSIYSGIASDSSDNSDGSKIPMETVHDDESPDKRNSIFDPNTDRDSSITCHEIGLFIPTVRLNNWIERYYKYKNLGNRMPSRSEMPVIKCNLPNLVIDPTEYTHGDQSITAYENESSSLPTPSTLATLSTPLSSIPKESKSELVRLYIREQDWNLIHTSFNKWALEHDIDYQVLDKNPIPVFEHLGHYILCIFDTTPSEIKKEKEKEKEKETKVMKFLQLLYGTYAYPTLFIFKTPKSVSKNWSTYYHLVDGIFTPQTTDESNQLSHPNVWHVIFYNMKTHRRAMPFASVMSNEFEHDKADSVLACLPVGPKVSDIIEDVELIMQDEPCVRLP